MLAEAVQQPQSELSLADICKDVEAFETDRWAIESIFDVELMTPVIVDPCAGTGLICRVAHEHGHQIRAFDIMPWTGLLPMHLIHWSGVQVKNWLEIENLDLTDATVVMNPPFSKACEFVDHAQKLNARKIVCFQRLAWRESKGRREWWEANRPARTWVCGERASCLRFDLLTCSNPEGHETCPNFLRAKMEKADRPPRAGGGCARCLSTSPTAHAWRVWERGHTGAEITSAIYPRSPLLLDVKEAQTESENTENE